MYPIVYHSISDRKRLIWTNARLFPEAFAVLFHIPRGPGNYAAFFLRVEPKLLLSNVRKGPVCRAYISRKSIRVLFSEV